MKNAMIFHGTGGSPESCWHPSIKTFLEGQGYEVWVPQLPGSENPDIDVLLPFVMEHGTFSEETVLIGHSAGCPLILGILEKLEKPVAKAIMVAAFMTQLGDKKEPILKDSYDWDKIKQNATEIMIINSDNDPWGCHDAEGKKILDHLKRGTLIVPHGQGHMGSEKYNQPYKEFPLLEQLLK